MRRTVWFLGVLVGLLLVVARPSAVTTTYYVSAQAVGADNSACDGLSPTYLSAGHCPFKDLTSPAVRNRLQNTNSVTFKFCGRDVVYDVGATALIIHGTGSFPAQANTVMPCDGDTPILDGGYLARETVRLSGSYVRISGMVIRRARDYGIECRGGSHVEILNNTISDNFASDLLKGDGGCSDATVTNNLLTQWVSQCMDLAGTARWVISGNRCYGPKVAGQPAIGVKFESDDITVQGNVFYGSAVGVSMGGVSSSHSGTYEALRMKVVDNAFYALTSFVADVYSCLSCEFRNNQVWSGAGGVRLGGTAVQGQSGCNSGAGNCTPTTGFVASANTFRSLKGTPNNSFWLLWSTERRGLAISGSLYCTYPGDTTDRYAVDGTIATRAQWQAFVRTDTDATIAPASDPRCGGHAVAPAAPTIIGVF
jgi:hypothetical protein